MSKDKEKTAEEIAAELPEKVAEVVSNVINMAEAKEKKEKIIDPAAIEPPNDGKPNHVEGEVAASTAAELPPLDLNVKVPDPKPVKVRKPIFNPTEFSNNLKGFFRVFAGRVGKITKELVQDTKYAIGKVAIFTIQLVIVVVMLAAAIITGSLYILGATTKQLVSVFKRGYNGEHFVKAEYIQKVLGFVEPKEPAAAPASAPQAA